MENSEREWFYEGVLLTGDEAEEHLRIRNKHILKLRKDTVYSLTSALEYLKNTAVESEDSYSSYYRNVCELGETLSVIGCWLEPLVEELNKL